MTMLENLFEIIPASKMTVFHVAQQMILFFVHNGVVLDVAHEFIVNFMILFV